VAVPVAKAKTSSRAVLLTGWARRYRLADAAMVDFQKIFLQAVAETQGALILSRVEEALAKNDVAGAEAAIDWQQFERELGALQNPVHDLMTESGKLATEDLNKLGFKLLFDIINPRAVAWARDRVGNLIREVSEGTRQAIRQLIAAALERGGHPYDTARRIRQYIGLTERQMRALDNYWERLSIEGLPARRVDEMVDAYARRLLRDRAKLIARTETIQAAAEGARESWRQAVDAGLLREDEWEREWITTEDDRTCEVCLAMDGKRAPINGAYENGSGGPTLHPACRCTEGLRRKEV